MTTTSLADRLAEIRRRADIAADEQCEGTLGLGNFDAPPERCDEDRLPGYRFCAEHLPWDEPAD